MKKTLLLSAALLSGVCAFAQEDITPANYKFATATDIPWLPGHWGDPNIINPTENVWEAANFAQYYNNGLWIDASAGQNEQQQIDFKDAWTLIDLGGEVGQVACFAGNASGIVDYLNKNYPEMAESWGKIKVDQNNSMGFNLHLCLNPTFPGPGYIHYKFVYNVFSNVDGINNNVITNIGGTGNTNSTPGTWTPAANLSAKDCIKTYEDGEPDLDRDGNPIWDPTKWRVVEFDQVCSEGGWPARFRFQAQGGGAWNNYAVFFKELSVTYYEEEWLNEEDYKVLTLGYEYFDDVMTPNTGAVESLVNENAPVEYYNLQGVKVAQPQNGIFIRKQGNKTSKIVVR